jgi:hypothetical protein
MRQFMLVLSVALLATAILVLPAFSTRIETVIYDDGKGTMSVGVGGTGPKVMGVMPQAILANLQKFRHQPRASAEETLLAMPEEVLVEYQAAAETPFEDGYVSAEFGTELWTGTTGGGEWAQWADVAGISLTGWSGSDPWFSDVIELRDSWRFYGASVFVSVPSGGGYSVVGTTAKRFIRYTRGDKYEYWNNNYGIEALTAYYISAMRETASGSHFLTDVWMGASATQYKSLPTW